jgi:hypothetical protein
MWIQAAESEPLDWSKICKSQAEEPDRVKPEEPVATIAVKSEPQGSGSSGSIDWDSLEIETPPPTPPPPPKHEPGDELEWPGTMAAYRASVDAVTIVIDDD